MNYKDLIGIQTPNFRTLAYIPNFCKISNFMYASQKYLMLNIYQVFEDKKFIDLNSKDLNNGEDYFTVFSIKEAIKDHYGNDIYRKISANNLDNMVEDVFNTLDWQYPSSLLDADNYLDGYMEDLEFIEREYEYE